MSTVTATVANPDNAKGRMTGLKFLLMMCAFFGVIIAVNLVLAMFALSTDTGLVVRNSYVASQDFSKMQAAADAQERLGWTMSAELESESIRLRIVDAESNNLDGLSFNGTVGRPVSKFRDQTLTFVDLGGGIYRAPAQLGVGTWQVDVTASTDDGQTFRRIFRLEGRAPG